MDIVTGKPDQIQGMYAGATRVCSLRRTEAQIAQLGIGRKFQKPTVFESQSVYENLLMASGQQRSSVFGSVPQTQPK